jgi:hypothetical protein
LNLVNQVDFVISLKEDLMAYLKNFNLLIMMVLVGLSAWAGCAPVAGPTLNEVRSDQTPGRTTIDTPLQPGEIRAEVTEVDPSRREIRVQTNDGRTQVLGYDSTRTRVMYNNREYNVDQLERGDIVVFETSPKDAKYVETIRIQEPTQGARLARRSPLPPRADVIEGTVEKVQYDLGVFDVRSRTGRMVTVSIPYNAKPADVENFRRLRRGDYVRVEGEFVNSESLQLLAFLSPR